MKSKYTGDMGSVMMADLSAETVTEYPRSDEQRELYLGSKIKELDTFPKENGINDVLVVTGSGMVHCDQVQPILNGFEANGIRYTL